MLEVLLVDYDKVPFTCSYVPSENMKAMAPIYALVFVLGASAFANMGYAALHGGVTGTVLTLTLTLVFGTLRVFAARQPRLAPVDFEEAPVSHQTLNLSG